MSRHLCRSSLVYFTIIIYSCWHQPLALARNLPLINSNGNNDDKGNFLFRSDSNEEEKINFSVLNNNNNWRQPSRAWDGITNRRNIRHSPVPDASDRIFFQSDSDSLSFRNEYSTTTTQSSIKVEHVINFRHVQKSVPDSRPILFGAQDDFYFETHKKTVTDVPSESTDDDIDIADGDIQIAFHSLINAPSSGGCEPDSVKVKGKCRKRVG